MISCSASHLCYNYDLNVAGFVPPDFLNVYKIILHCYFALIVCDLTGFNIQYVKLVFGLVTSKMI